MPPNNTPDDTPDGLLLLPGLPSEDAEARAAYLDTATDLSSLSLSEPYSQTAISQGSPSIDWAALDYVNPVDENLLCAICKTPFHEPVTTIQCRHTFCEVCIDQHLRNLDDLGHDEACPLCRTDLTETTDDNKLYSPSDRIVIALLDDLVVKCPGKLCRWTGARGSLEPHATTCDSILVPCVDECCTGVIMRGSQGQICLHHKKACELCGDIIVRAQQLEHRATVCPKVPVKCPTCEDFVERKDSAFHSHLCSVRVVSCKHKDTGCRHMDQAKGMAQHQETCIYGLFVSLEDRLGKQIRAVENRVAAIEAEQAGLREAIKERPKMSTADDSTDGDGIRDQAQQAIETLDAIDRRMSEISNWVMARDALYPSMVHREMVPFLEQLAEIRSQQNVQSMHIRWLMDMHRTRQRQNIANAFSGSSASTSGSRSDTASAETDSDGAAQTTTTPLIIGRSPGVPNGRTTPPRPSL